MFSRAERREALRTKGDLVICDAGLGLGFEFVRSRIGFLVLFGPLFTFSNRNASDLCLVPENDAIDVANGSMFGSAAAFRTTEGQELGDEVLLTCVLVIDAGSWRFMEAWETGGSGTAESWHDDAIGWGTVADPRWRSFGGEWRFS
jgi:hypothetical protein